LLEVYVPRRSAFSLYHPADRRAAHPHRMLSRVPPS
jgi:hypothetical protein